MFVIDSVSSVCLVLELTTSRGQKKIMNEKSSFFKKWLMDDDTDDDVDWHWLIHSFPHLSPIFEFGMHDLKIIRKQRHDYDKIIINYYSLSKIGYYF